MISKKKTTKRHDGVVSLMNEEIPTSKCQVDAKMKEQDGDFTNAKKKRSRFVVSIVESRKKGKEDCDDSSDLKSHQTTTEDDAKNNNNTQDGAHDDMNYPSDDGVVKKSDSFYETRGRPRTLDRTRKISSVLQPTRSLITHDEEPYVVQPIIYSQQQFPLIQLSSAQLIPLNLLAGKPRRTISHCVLSLEIPFDGRLMQIRDRSLPSLRRYNARLYEKYNVGLATAKENLRRYCLNRMTESNSKSMNCMAESMFVDDSNHVMCQNEGVCQTFSAPLESVTLFPGDCKQSIQHCATIMEDSRPEVPLAHLPALPIGSMMVPCETSQQAQLPRVNNALVNQIRQQEQHLQQIQKATADKPKIILNRRRQSDLGSIAMMQRKIKVNGVTDVINFDDLRERLEQLTGTTCYGNAGVNCPTANNVSKNKKSIENKNGAMNPTMARNQRHNSIAVVENQDAERSLDVSIRSSQDMATPLKSFLVTTCPLSTTNLQHSQSTMALSSLVTASTQTNPDTQTPARRHSNHHHQIVSSPLEVVDPNEVGVLGGSRLDDSLSLDDVVSLIQAGEPLYDVTSDDSFWRLLAEGFESGLFQIASKEEANEESLFECPYDEELDKVAVVMVDDAGSQNLSDELFQETLTRQSIERDSTRKRQARERYELHRWYVRHGRPPPRLSLESIYFSSFFRKDANKPLPPVVSSASEQSIVSIVCSDDASHLQTTSESLAYSNVSSNMVPEHSLEVPRPHDLKSTRQHSFSSEDDNYNSIDRHFNMGGDNDAVDLRGLVPPKSPWEVAYNKRAEQLSTLLQQQSKDYHHHHHQFKAHQQQLEQQRWSHVTDSLPNLMHQLHKKKQQIISLTELLLSQQQHFQQKQQPQANIIEQLSELMRCQSQHHFEPNSFSKHHPMDFISRFQSTSCCDHLQKIIANQKFRSEIYSDLQSTPCSMIDPRISGMKYSNSDLPNLAMSNSQILNLLNEILARLNCPQKNQLEFSSPMSKPNPDPTLLHSPFQPICKESLFQPVHPLPPATGNLLFSLADQMSLDGHPNQDKLCQNFMKSLHPPQNSVSTFLSELHGQQNQQQLYNKQQQNIWDQMALFHHLQHLQQ